jgi:hypothetical protein
MGHQVGRGLLPAHAADRRFDRQAAIQIGFAVAEDSLGGLPVLGSRVLLDGPPIAVVLDDPVLAALLSLDAAHHATFRGWRRR